MSENEMVLQEKRGKDGNKVNKLDEIVGGRERKEIEIARIK